LSVGFTIWLINSKLLFKVTFFSISTFGFDDISLEMRVFTTQH